NKKESSDIKDIMENYNNIPIHIKQVKDAINDYKNTNDSIIVNPPIKCMLKVNSEKHCDAFVKYLQPNNNVLVYDVLVNTKSKSFNIDFKDICWGEKDQPKQKDSKKEKVKQSVRESVKELKQEQSKQSVRESVKELKQEQSKQSVRESVKEPQKQLKQSVR